MVTLVARSRPQGGSWDSRGEQAVTTTAHAATTELHEDADEFNAAEIGAIAHLYRG
jgi:hypothetical protein